MINVCLIGYGNWGKKVLHSLREIKTIKKIYLIKNRKDKKNIVDNNLKWIFVTANVSSHYSIVKKYLKKKINVFCEKPLTNSLKKDVILFNIAKKNNCKLYVSDIENYKKKKINLRKKNTIIRNKFSNNKSNIIERLTYHDFTYLFKFFKNKKYKNLQILKKSTGKLHFSLNLNNRLLIFKYDLNSKIKKHKFNNCNLISSKNILKIMLLKVINDEVNFTQNRKISLFANKISNIIDAKL